MGRIHKLRLIVTLFILFLVPVGVYLVMNPISFIGKAFGKEANLVIDAGSSYSIETGIWQNLAQGGAESDRMLSPVIEQTKNLRPRYIRIDHVLDSYDLVSRDLEGDLILNWQNLDETLSDIRNIGATPFISISYMPLELSGKDVTDLPKNWDEWKFVVKSTIEHVSGINNLGFDNVYYEVWNEPDLFGKFSLSGRKNYLDLYKYTANAADEAQNVLSYKLGGPAVTKYYKNWLEQVVDYAEKNNLRMDFYSWHLYSENISAYDEDVNAIKRYLSSKNKNLELVISETGIDSKNNQDYDGNLSAIHTIAASAVLEGKISKLFSFQIKDIPGPTKYWGNWGILTNEKYGYPQPKPRYKALEFLNNMSGQHVNVAGQGSWIKSFAKREGTTIRLLVVNYDPASSHYESVPIKFINLPFTNFTFKRTDFLGGINEYPVNSETGSWSTTEIINPNSGSIFELVEVK